MCESLPPNLGNAQLLLDIQSFLIAHLAGRTSVHDLNGVKVVAFSLQPPKRVGPEAKSQPGHGVGDNN